jgi:hypothetical protein
MPHAVVAVPLILYMPLYPPAVSLFCHWLLAPPLSLQTLTNSHWSMKPAPPVRLPPVITACCEQFSAFYVGKFKSGRRLTWLTHVGGTLYYTAQPVVLLV